MSCRRQLSRVAGQTHTPSNAGTFLAARFASFASVRVSAIPTHTGTPSSRCSSSLIDRPSRAIASGSAAVRRSTVKNASSIEYTSRSCVKRSKTSTGSPDYRGMSF